MDDKVRLIDAEALKNYMCSACPNKERCEDTEQVCSAILDVDEQPTIEVEPDNGWISVKDRLPEDNGKYVVWSDGELNICEYDVESQTFGDTFYDYDEMYSKLLCWDDYINKLVTHWLPTKPPKGE